MLDMLDLMDLSRLILQFLKPYHDNRIQNIQLQSNIYISCHKEKDVGINSSPLEKRTCSKTLMGNCNMTLSRIFGEFSTRHVMSGIRGEHNRRVNSLNLILTLGMEP